MGNAERFEWRYGSKFAFTAATGWLVYEEGVWRRDETKSVVRAMQSTVRLIERETELVDTGNEKTDSLTKEAIVGWAKKSESSSKINAALEQASALNVFAKNYTEFDRKPHLFNVKNGTIDLRTGEFTRHDPKHLLTKQSPIEYDPKAECPNWEQFILDIMGGKHHMRQYLCRCAGYTLTADTGGQCVFVPWGPGGTGKSTFLSVMRGVMGDYCKQADSEMFMVKRGDSGQPFEMAGMEGTRLLMAVETEQGKKLALAKLKKMTGQDPIAACYKFQHQYEFVPAVEGVAGDQRRADHAGGRRRVVGSRQADPVQREVPGHRGRDQELRRNPAERGGTGHTQLVPRGRRGMEAGWTEPSRGRGAGGGCMARPRRLATAVH